MKLKRILKISNRVKNMIRVLRMNYIKHNGKYKPVGIKKLRLKDPGIELLEINPPHTSTLNLEPKFLEDCSPYIKTVLTVEYPSDYVATIKDGRIFAYDPNNFAVVSGDNYLIDEASFQWEDSLVEVNRNMILKVKGFTKPQKYSGRVFSLLTMGAAKYYYYHWVFDAMAKLDLLKKSGLFDKVDYFLVPNYAYDYNKGFLAHFGITEEKIIDGEIEHHIQADLLMVCSEIRIEEHLPNRTCDFFYKSFSHHFDQKRRGRPIFIARGDAAKNRKAANESEVIAILESYGFQICYLSKYSIVEQAKLFNSTDLIVAVHGGGLSNLVYCEPGTKVLEIFPDQYVRHYFYDICTKRGLVYDYFLCESEKPCTNHFDGEAVGLTVDIEELKRKLKSFTNDSSSDDLLRQVG